MGRKERCPSLKENREDALIKMSKLRVENNNNGVK